MIIEGCRQAEAQGCDWLLHRLHVIFGGVFDAVDVGRVIAGHLVEHESGVFNGASDGAAVVERGAAGNDATDGDKSDGWLEADDAAPGRWHADTAAGVGAKRPEAEIGSNGCTGTGGGATTDTIKRPGITRGTEVGDVTRATDGEFVQVEFSDDDGPSEFETADDVGVFCGDAVFEHGTGSGGAGASGVDVGFECDRDTV